MSQTPVVRQIPEGSRCSYHREPDVPDCVQEEFEFGHTRHPASAQNVCLGEWKVVPVHCAGPECRELIRSPEAVVQYWNHYIRVAPTFNPEVECVAVIALGCRLGPKGHQVIAVGTVDEAIVHPREVFRAAIVASAYVIILVHNHPSGDPTPSKADIQVTERIKVASEVVQIRLQDHVIIGAGTSYYSFRSSGNVL